MIRKNIPVCLCCDVNYLRYTCVTISSIAYNNTNSFIDFYVLHTGISLNTQLIIKNWVEKTFENCSLSFLDITSHLKSINMKQIRYFNSLVFGRYFIPELLPMLDKVIYLDSDIIVLNDIEKLYDIDLSGYSIGAVYEYWLDNKDWGQKIKEDISYLKLSSNHEYFSSGVLLIDSKQWREKHIKDALLSLYSEYREIAKFPDQDPLNKLFENNYKKLDMVFNVTDQTIIFMQKQNLEKLYLNLKNNIVVRHFAGDNKPWNQVSLYKDIEGKDCADNFNDWWFFASMTPFINGLENKFLERKMSNFKKYEIPKLINSNSTNLTDNRTRILFRLFDKIPLLAIKKKNNKTVYRIFNLLPLLTIIKRGN